MIAIFPEIVAASAKQDLELLAVLARRYFGGGETYAPKPDVRALLLSAGVEVESLPLDTPGALVAKDERGAFSIVAIASNRGGVVESRFLLAHMLGHVLLDVLPVIARGDWQVSGLRETQCPMKRYVQGGLDRAPSYEDRREELADRFAAALLMPLGMVKRAESSFKDLDKTAHFFGVPRVLLERRLVDLGVIAPSPVNFLDAEKLARPAEPPREATPASLSTPEPTMPRSYAASTYGNTERSTRREGKPSEPKSPAPRPERRTTSQLQGEPKAADPRSKDPQGSGMARLRELAKRLEKPAKG